LGRKRGEIEEWLRRIVWGGFKDEYVVYIRFRREDGVEELYPIPATHITDLRHGYMYVHGEPIPLHRVVEIRDKNGVVVYRRRGFKEKEKTSSQ